MDQRILGLELLRGMCAMAVAIYHCMLWGGVAHMYSWGLYGVYIFFVISGAVLWRNYHDRLSLYGDGRTISLAEFMARRFARLAPLYTLCALIFATFGIWGPWRDALNLSLLFGLTNPGDVSTVIGGWSIGIEFVFYALFPVMLALARDMRTSCAILATLLIVRVAYVETVLNGETLESAWSAYTQVGTFAVFFFAGILIAKARIPLRLALPCSILSLAVIFAIPVDNRESILTGITGVIYALAAMTVAAGFFWTPANKTAASVCQFFGDISYGVYLIHPIAWKALEEIWPASGAISRMLAALVIAVTASWLALHLYEKPAKRWLLQMAERPLRIKA